MGEHQERESHGGRAQGSPVAPLNAGPLVGVTVRTDARNEERGEKRIYSPY